MTRETTYIHFLEVAKRREEGDVKIGTERDWDNLSKPEEILALNRGYATCSPQRYQPSSLFFESSVIPSLIWGLF